MRNMRSAVIVRHSAAGIVVVASDGQSVWNGPQVYRAISCYCDRPGAIACKSFQ